jgi:hypothetical protein
MFQRRPNNRPTQITQSDLVAGSVFGTPGGHIFWRVPFSRIEEPPTPAGPLDVLDDDGGSSDTAGGDPVVTAPCGCLVLDDEWCRICGGCRPRGAEWAGCCRCGVVTPDATDGGRS